MLLSSCPIKWQESRLEIDRRSARLATIQNNLQLAQIDPQLLDHEGNRPIAIVACDHGDARLLQVDVDEIASGNPALEHLGASDEHAEPRGKPRQHRRRETEPVAPETTEAARNSGFGVGPDARAIAGGKQQIAGRDGGIGRAAEE